MIGFFFFYLLFGCLLSFLVDLMFGFFCEEIGMNYLEYIEKWKVVMKEVYELVR